MPRHKAAASTGPTTALCRVDDVDDYHATMARTTARCIAVRANYIPPAAYDADTNPAVTIVIKNKVVGDPHQTLPTKPVSLQGWRVSRY